MDKKQFLAECEKFSRENLDYRAEAELRSRTQAGRGYRYGNSAPLPVTAFHALWSTGGMSGGSCWGGEPRPYHSDDPEAELEGLDLFLEAHFPSVTFLTYRRLERAIKRETFVEPEYYGNSTDYVMKTLEFSHVWDVLLATGLLSES